MTKKSRSLNCVKLQSLLSVVVVLYYVFFPSTYDADAVLMAAGITTVSNDDEAAAEGALLFVS